jgi:hypothetical protein
MCKQLIRSEQQFVAELDLFFGDGEWQVSGKRPPPVSANAVVVIAKITETTRA